MQIKFRISEDAWNNFTAQTETPAATIRHLVANYSSDNLENVMGVQEASELWELSPGYIKNLCAAGKIKARNIGKTWIIDKHQPNPKGGVNND